MTVPGQIFEWEGITQPSYWGGQPLTDTGHAAMDQIAATGANTLTLIPNFFQVDKFSSSVALRLGDPNNPWDNESDTFEQVKQAILDAKARGLNVVLKPHVESENRVWRAEFAPTDPKAWFASYKAMMVEYAKVAQEAGAEMICVGTEMVSMTNPTKVCSDGKTYTQKWAEIIEAVRAVYSGKVTYAATYDEVVHVGFWDKVDYIGVDAYIPSSTVNDPTVDQIVNAWVRPHFNPWIRDTLYGGKSVVDYYKSLSERYGKKVIFTEVGYKSMDGANKDPGVFGGTGTVDLEEQVDCYTALFHVMEHYGGQWLAGAFLWSYYSFANPMEERDVPWTDYTTQHKPANETVTMHYSAPAHETGLVWNGTAGHDKLDGGYHNDTLNGGAGNDTLWGGAGVDRMEGGAGNDTYTVDNDGDLVIEAAGGGSDTVVVLSSASVTDFANIENLTAAGSSAIALTGDGAANILMGNGAANTLTGDGGEDVLDGGAGSDHLEAGMGNDTYYVDNAGDVIVEAADGGLDTVMASVSFSMAAFAHVERMIATGTAALSLTGNAEANTLLGNAAGNGLTGKAGNDTLDGAGGNDVLMQEAADGNDSLVGGAGIDTVVFSGTAGATVNVTLATAQTTAYGSDIFSGIENLTGGSGADRFTGSSLVNVLRGNAGADTLKGMNGNDLLYGGTHNDRLYGGAHNDRLYGEANDDLLYGDAGNDLLYGGLRHDRLYGGAHNDKLYGEDGNDLLRGDVGNDVLSGGNHNDKLYGGAGKDVLTGGTGRDIFVFNTALNRSTNVDRITDFSVRDDTVWLDNRYMAKLGTGTEVRPGRLNSKYLAFDTAKDANDYLIYVRKSGVLLYDADGSGAGAAVAMAILKPGLKLTYADFQII